MNRQLLVFGAMGFECVGLVTVCVLIGRYFDSKYGWGGLGAAAGALIGTSAWITHLVVVMRNLAKDEESGDTDA